MIFSLISTAGQGFSFLETSSLPTFFNVLAASTFILPGICLYASHIVKAQQALSRRLLLLSFALLAYGFAYGLGYGARGPALVSSLSLVIVYLLVIASRFRHIFAAIFVLALLGLYGSPVIALMTYSRLYLRYEGFGGFVQSIGEAFRIFTSGQSAAVLEYLDYDYAGRFNIFTPLLAIIKNSMYGFESPLSLLSVPFSMLGPVLFKILGIDRPLDCNAFGRLSYILNESDNYFTCIRQTFVGSVMLISGNPVFIILMTLFLVVSAIFSILLIWKFFCFAHACIWGRPYQGRMARVKRVWLSLVSLCLLLTIWDVENNFMNLLGGSGKACLSWSLCFIIVFMFGSSRRIFASR
jgi:hypothetical protein